MQHVSVSSFIIDTTYTDVIVSTTQCGQIKDAKGCAYPVYNETESSTYILKHKNNTIHTPSQVIGTFTGDLVMDQVCVYDTACANNVEFYALMNNWGFYNILGLAPINAVQGPNLIRMLY